jgi:hypothetical protein
MVRVSCRIAKIRGFRRLPADVTRRDAEDPGGGWSGSSTAGVPASG